MNGKEIMHGQEYHNQIDWNDKIWAYEGTRIDRQ